MSGFVRRIMAFLLGVAVGAVALFGGVASGALWAYRNMSPDKIIDGASDGEEDGGILADASVEKLVEVLRAAKNAEDGYSLGRLEKEFGIELKDLLAKMGVDVANANDKDYQALSEINVFALLSKDGDGLEELLSSIRFRALYALVPALIGKDIDEVLSVEAQEKLGDYTFAELLKVNETTGHTKLLMLVEDLTLGALFPKTYEPVYDADKHIYNYLPRPTAKPGLTAVLGDIPIGAIFNIIEGNSISRELVDGKLSAFAELPVSKILNALALNIGVKEGTEFLQKVAKTLGDSLTLRDFYIKNVDGSYSFTGDEAVRNLNLGYMFGYYTDGEGNWFKDKNLTKAVDGIPAVISKLNFGEIFEGGETIDTIEAIFGDVSLLSLYESFAEDEDIPFVVKALGDMTVSDIIAEGQEKITQRLIENLNLYIGDYTVDRIIEDLLSEEDKQTVENSSILSALVASTFSTLIKNEYTDDSFLGIVEAVFGNLDLSDVVDDFTPDWRDSPTLTRLLENNKISDVVALIKGEAVLEDKIGDITLGDLVSEVNDDWQESELLSELFETTISDLIKISKGEKDVEDVVGDITLGDIVSEFNDDWQESELLSDLLATTISELIELSKGEKDVEDIVGDITLGDIVSEFNDDWQESELLSDLLATTISDLIAISDGEKDIKDIVGDITLGDIVSEFNDDWQESELLSDLLATTISDLIAISEGEKEVEDIVGDITLGDIVSEFTTDWQDSELLTDLLATTISDLIAISEGEKEVEDIVGDITLGDIVSEFTTDWQDSELLTDLLATTISDLIAISNGEKEVEDIVGDITLGEIVSEFTTDWQDSELLTDLLATTISDLIAISNGEKEVEDIVGDITLGEIVSEFTTDWQDSELLTDLLATTISDLIAISNGEKDITDIIGDITLGDIVSEFTTDWQDYDSLTTLLAAKVTDIIDVANGEKTLLDVYGDLTFGDLLCDLIDPDDEDVVMKEALKVLFETEISVFENGFEEGFEAILQNLLVGDLLSEFVSSAVDAMNFEQTVEKDDEGYSVDGFMGAAFEKLYNLNAYYVYDTLRQPDGAKTILGEFSVGDLAAGIVGKIIKATGIDEDFVINNDNGVYSVDGIMSKVLKELFNMNAADAFDTFRTKDGIIEFVGRFSVGDYVAEIAYELSKRIRFIDHFSVGCDDNGVYSVDGFMSVFFEKTFNLNVGYIYDTILEDNSLSILLGEYLVGDLTANIVEKVVNKVLDRFDLGELSVGYENGVYSAEGFMKVALEKTFNLNVGYIYDTIREDNGLGVLLSEYKIGDLAAGIVGTVVNKVLDRFDLGELLIYNDNGVYSAEGFMEVALEKTFNLNAGYVYDTIREPDGFKTLLGEYLVGDLAAGIVGTAMRRTGIDEDFDIINNGGVYTVDGWMEHFLEKLFNMNAADAFDTFRTKAGIKTFLKQFKVGEFVARIGNKAALLIGDPVRHEVAETVTIVDGEKVYDYSVEGWFDGVANVIYNMYIDTAFDTFTDVTEIKNLILGFKVGDIFGEVIESVLDKAGYDHNVSYASATGKYSVTGYFDTLGGYFYNLTVADVNNNGKATFNILIGDYLSDLVEILKATSPNVYNGTIEKTAGGSYVAHGDFANVLNVFVNLKLLDLLDTIRDEGMEYLTGDAMLGGLRVGAILNYYYDEANDEWYLDEEMTDPVTYANDSQAAMIKAVYRIKLSDLLAMDMDAIFGDLYVGELFGYEKNGAVWEKDGAVVNATLYGLLDKTVSELTNGNLYDLIIESMAGVELGELLGYEKVAGVWKKNNVAATGIDALLLDYTVDDIMNSSFESIVGDWTLADILGREIASATGIDALLLGYTVSDLINNDFETIVGDWTLADILDRDIAAATGLDKKLLVLTVNEISSSNFDEIIGAWYIGEVFGYELDGTVWKKDGVPANELYASFYDYTVDELITGNLTEIFSSVVSGWKVGSVLGFYYNEDDSKWYENYNAATDTYSGLVTGITDKVSRKTIAQVASGFGAIINDFTLGEVIDVTGNPILASLADENVGDLSDAINALTFGAIMGYEKEAGVWKKNGTPADELTAVIADFTIADFGNDDFVDDLKAEIMGGVSVGYFFPNAGGTGFMSLVDPDWVLDDLEDNLNAAIASATIEDMIAFGAFGNYYDDADNLTDTDELFIFMHNGDAAYGRDYWQGLTMDGYMTELVSFMGNVKGFFEDNPAIAAQYYAWLAAQP